MLVLFSWSHSWSCVMVTCTIVYYPNFGVIKDPKLLLPFEAHTMLLSGVTLTCKPHLWPTPPTPKSHAVSHFFPMTTCQSTIRMKPIVCYCHQVVTSFSLISISLELQWLNKGSKGDRGQWQFWHFKCVWLDIYIVGTWKIILFLKAVLKIECFPKSDYNIMFSYEDKLLWG